MIPNIEEVRRTRVDHARRRISALRERHDGRTLVLSSVGAVAWATGGVSEPIDRVAGVDPVWVVVRDAGTTLVVSSVEVPRLTAESSAHGLDFEIVGAPWFEPRGHADAVERIVGAPLATCLADGGEGEDVTTELIGARLALGTGEVAVLSALAGVATGAVEGAAHAWRPGVSTDRDVAALVQADLERAGAEAVCLIVGGDDRVRSFRHPLAGGRPVASLLMVVVVARYQGLHVALTRLAATQRDERLEERLALCDEIHQAVLDATRRGVTWGDAYRALGDAYGRAGAPDAWREHFQGGPIGYAQREFELAPTSSASPWWSETVDTATAVAWNPSLSGGAKIEDTYLVDEDGLRLLTDGGGWPRRAGPRSGAAVWVR
ncbi:MAG: M24 family metallopeptidase [Acidimicrobiales bacterium]